MVKEMGKLVNEETAAGLVGVTHRQMVRWRKERVKGKNPPYFVVPRGKTIAHLYDLDLLDMWLRAKNQREIESKIPERRQTVFPMGGEKWVAENLIEGEQVYIPKGKSAPSQKMSVEEAISLSNESVNDWCGGEFVTFLDYEGATHIRVHRR